MKYLLVVTTKVLHLVLVSHHLQLFQPYLNFLLKAVSAKCTSLQVYVHVFRFILDLLTELLLPLPFAFKSMQRLKFCDNQIYFLFKHMLLPHGLVSLSHGFTLTSPPAPPGLFAL